MALVNIVPNLLDERPQSRSGKTKSFLPPAHLESNIDGFSGNNASGRSGDLRKVLAKRRASVNLVLPILVIHDVMQRKVVEHGLFTSLDFVEIRIHGPVSGVGPGNTASLGTGIRMVIACGHRALEARTRYSSIGDEQEPNNPSSKTRREGQDHHFPHTSEQTNEW